MGDLLLGIDLGSTSLKAVAYDLDGRKAAAASRPTEKRHPNPDHPEWTVWDPREVWEGAAAAVAEVVAAIADPARIRGVAVTGMGMDGVPVDDAGCWLYPFISWHDPRTAPQLRWWQEHVGVERTFRIGGNPVWAINSALRILWMAEHEPAILARADKWLLIEDFVNFMLCGRRATDYSMASCTMLFDQRTRGWSDELLSAAGIDRRLLVEVLPSATPLGEVSAAAARQTGLRPGTPVILGGHDHLCGALPVGAFRPGVVLDTTGTWEVALATVPRPVLDPALARMGMTVQAHVARGVHTIWGGCVAGEMVEWHRREIGHRAPAVPEQGGDAWSALVSECAAALPGAGGVMFLPHMSGAACPVLDDRSRGAFVGLSSRTTAAEMLRAVIEGLDYQFRDIVTSLETTLAGLAAEQTAAQPATFDTVIAVGGATKNPFWMQNKADVLGRPIEVPDIAEATPLGAAILAGIGLGLYRDESDAFARVYRPGKTYRPDPRLTAFYAERFAVYQQLYPALRPLHHALPSLD
jgi:xylulokinase